MSNVSQWNASAAGNNAAPPNGFPEGQTPASLNDSGREVMAAISRWYRDMQGTLLSSGSGGAYTLSTNSMHSALDRQSVLVFRAHVTCTASPTLSVDGLSALPIETPEGVALFEGAMTIGGVYQVIYDANDSRYVLLNPTYHARRPRIISVTGDITVDQSYIGSMMLPSGATRDIEWPNDANIQVGDWGWVLAGDVAVTFSYASGISGRGSNGSLTTDVTGLSIGGYCEWHKVSSSVFRFMGAGFTS